jgi:hypothetical protein
MLGCNLGVNSGRLLTRMQILVQKLDLFYGLKFVDFGYQLMLTLFVQLMGRFFVIKKT